MKFYPADWRADPALRMCGLAARGLWIEMLALMHEASPRGSLLVNGKTVSPRQLAVLAGCTEAEIESSLKELSEAGVFSVRRNGILYSRRMERDEIKASKLRANGKLGGNPSLRKQTIIEPLDNQGDITTEARSQIPESEEEKRETDVSLQESEKIDLHPVEKARKQTKAEEAAARRAEKDRLTIEATADFDAFWPTYAKGPRNKALPAYVRARLDGATAEGIVESVKAWRRTRAERYMPDTHRFFTDDYHKTEPLPGGASPPQTPKPQSASSRMFSSLQGRAAERQAREGTQDENPSLQRLIDAPPHPGTDR